MIQIQSLTKTYGRNQPPALDSASFEVRDGEIVGFVGLNGAGKTTTIRLAVGVSLPTSGTVVVDGYDIVKDKAKASEKIGWVPEFPNYELNAKVKSLLNYFAGFYGLSGEEADKRIKQLIASVGLTGYENRKLRTYSQGMKKRFSLAASMISDPQNLLFDEILNGLDPEGIHFMRSLMLDLKRRNKAVLLSSHILTEVENIADRVVFVHRGKILQVVTRGELAVFGASGGSLKLVIQNLNEDAVNYLRTLSNEVMVDGNSVVISNFHGDSAQVNAELVRRGFNVRELSFEKSNLEEYFFKIVKEAG
jgi:ABC-2 type transport system ATP-binding protein